MVKTRWKFGGYYCVYDPYSIQITLCIVHNCIRSFFFSVKEREGAPILDGVPESQVAQCAADFFAFVAATPILLPTPYVYIVY